MTKLSFSWLLLALLVSQTQICAQETKAPVQIQMTVQTPGGMEKLAPMEQLNDFKSIPLMASPSKVQVRGPQPLRPNRKKIELECGLPPAIPLQRQQQQQEVKTTPEEDLIYWRAECLRRICSRWDNKDAGHSVCKVKLKENGDAQWIKVEKSNNDDSGKTAVAIIELSLPLRKAPNELPYTGTLKIEFLDYPNINLSVEK